MGQELVSVIMPTHNASKFVAGSIESILNQTYSNLELLITDDGSTDKRTIDIINNFSLRDSRVKVMLLNGNHGPGYTRNKSIERAKGRYIAFCDSDDRWFPEKLEKQIDFMKSKGCALSCTSYIICDDEDNETGINMALERISFGMMKRDNKIGCLTAIYDTQMLGGKFYMPTIRKRQDWALFLTIIKKCHIAYGITTPLAYYRHRNNSVSNKKLALIKYNIKVYEQILGFSRFKAVMYFFIFFLPTYYAKIRKRKRDSTAYISKYKKTNNPSA